jgi:hypothetical protein
MDALLKTTLDKVNEAVSDIPETSAEAWPFMAEEKIARAIHYVDALRSSLKAYTPKTVPYSSALTNSENKEEYRELIHNHMPKTQSKS